MAARTKSLATGEADREFLQRVLDGIAEPVLVIGTDRRVIMRNRAAESGEATRVNGRPVFCYQLSPDCDHPCEELGELCPLAEVMRTGEPVTATHIHRDADGRERVVELLASPYLDANGRLAGIVESVRDVTERRGLETRVRAQDRRIEYLERHDALTGLPNRRELIERAEQAIARARRSSTEAAFLYLDIDRFAEISAAYGTAVADEVLRATGARIRGVLTGADTLSYFGGDDFVVLIERAARGVGAALLGANVRVAVAAPCNVAGRAVYLTASIGVAHFPEDGEDAETLINRAAAAAHDARANGGDQVRSYLARMGGAQRETLQLEAELRNALEHREIEIWYQPQVDLGNGRIAGVEALARWHHPRLGWIGPERFIPVAERSGLIFPLGEQVLHAACSAAARWREAGLVEGRVAVNLSARQFRLPDLASGVAALLSATDCPGEAIEIEITESTLVDDAELAQDVLDALRRLQVSIAIDDFGTGYSSLKRLYTLPIDRVKIDRSFVGELPSVGDAQAVATAIINLAQSLQLEVVAEGIETAAQERFLRHAGCDIGQGFRYARPLPAAEFTAFAERASAAGARQDQP